MLCEKKNEIWPEPKVIAGGYEAKQKALRIQRSSVALDAQCMSKAETYVLGPTKYFIYLL